MFVQMKYFIVLAGSSYKVIERFVRKQNEGPSSMEQQQGFLSRELYVKKVDVNKEEVVVLIYWASEAQWQNYNDCLPVNDRLQVEQAELEKLDYIFECSYTNYRVKGGV
ncbi:antibiotic biosynthesis monooxygenase [Metasolibacillus meyeri]|uniref:Antibiotic biosynthesis monooxygenase n=1 Tax=Metasolibacillus meyeri TaxID=1071052 RepID=A0AAW9NQ50_9BACL|nr:antibiotic biosynthesis monooxygenase [Metasolibacillus meyeri]MEC1177988.1 antibiotic biosynthesis monooxygenase [Metasolibacillus meyeri]